MIQRTLFAAAGLLLAMAGSTPAWAAGGQTQFMENCAACHQPTGKGIPKAFPALAGNPLVQGDPKKVLLVVLNGRAGMPAFKSDLDDATLAAAVTYARGSWGNKGGPVTPAQVKAVRGGPAPAANRPLQAH